MEKEGLSGGLESALLDQRLRAEKHKTNFESLKAQHLILQDVCIIQTLFYVMVVCISRPLL